MSEIVKSLRERRARVWEEIKKIADRAAEENRELDAAENEAWEKGNAELDALDGRIKNIVDGETRAKEAEESFNRLQGKSGASEKRDGGQVQTPDEKELDEAFRALARGERRSVEVAMPSVAERRAQRAGQYEQRTPILTSNVPMPTTFIGQLYQYLVDTSSIRQANPTVYTTQTGENLTIPRSTAEGAASWFGENVQVTESNPTLSSVTLGAYKVGKTIYVSSELVQDTGFDLLGFLAEHSGRNIGIAVDSAYINGTGTGQPTGLVGAATVGIQEATGNTNKVVVDNLFDLYHSVIPQYRGRASWLFNDSTIKQIRQLKDSTNQYLWQPGLALGQPDTLLGRPVYADPNMPTMAANAKFGAFGDFSGYWIRDVTPLRFERSDDFRFDTDVVSFRVLYRTDGKLGDTNAVKLIQNSAT